MKGTSWILNEMIALTKCEGWDADLTSKIICNEQGEPLEPIWKSKVSFKGKEPDHYKQANFESRCACIVSIRIRKPEFFSDMAQVMSNNLPCMVMISKFIFGNVSGVLNSVGRGIFTLPQKKSFEKGFQFFCVSANLREKGLERFIDPMQKAYQKAWDFLLIGPDGECGKTYPAFVK